MIPSKLLRVENGIRNKALLTETCPVCATAFFLVETSSATWWAYSNIILLSKRRSLRTASTLPQKSLIGREVLEITSFSSWDKKEL